MTAKPTTKATDRVDPDEYIARIVAAAPPLNPRQKKRLTAILGPIEIDEPQLIRRKAA